MKKLILIVLSAALLLSACGQATEAAPAEEPVTANTVTTAETASSPKTTPNGVDKAETVYAKANADGTVTETTVEVTLKAQEGQTIPDAAALRDITNKEGDEDYTCGADNGLTWQNHGTSITYEGKSDAALPVTTRVTYYLDGQEIAPGALAGRSGRVRIRFDYTNNTRETVTVDGQDYTVCVPFTAVTALIMDGTKFTNIEAENGKVMDLDGQTAVLGMAMPGLADSLCLSGFEPMKDVEIPAFFEISADVTDFALDFTATILTPSALDDLDLSGIEDLTDLSDALDKLTDATDEVADGAGALADGIQAYYDGFQQYADGVKNLNEGAQTLADSLTQLYDNGQTLLTGINTLRDGLSAVSGSASSGTGTAGKETQAKLSEALTPAITDYGTTLVTDVCSDAELQAALGTLTPEQQKVLLSALQNALEKAAANDTPAFAGTVAATTSELLMQSMPGDFVQLLAGLDQLAQGTDTYMKAVGQVSQGASALADGSAQLNDASAELYDGLAELHDGAAALRDGVQEFSKKAGKELGDDFGDGLQNVVRRLKAVQQAGKAYQTFTGLADGMTGNVKFIVETAEIK